VYPRRVSIAWHYSWFPRAAVPGLFFSRNVCLNSARSRTASPQARFLVGYSSIQVEALKDLVSACIGVGPSISASTYSFGVLGLILPSLTGSW